MPRYEHILAKYPDDRRLWLTLLAAAALAFTLVFFVELHLGLSLPVFGQVVLFAVLTAVIGIPHGGLDHRFGRAICRPLAGKWWPVVFFVTYSSIGLLVLAGWVMVPLTTIAFFFLLSAIHFGEKGSLPMAAVEGGMVIWIPFLARPNEATALLALVTPGRISGSIQGVLSEARPLLWALAFVLAVHVTQLAFVGMRHRDRRSVLKACRLTAFAVVFAATPVLLSFATFFCGWHSTRELVDLAYRMDPSRPSRGLWRVLQISAPLSILLCAVITLAASWRFTYGYSLESVVVQGVFLGLSAVAVPHILLHAIADRFVVDPLRTEASS
jgi:Brp/Blh family beta-carotene 15,15'-monooxygenase